MPEAEESIDERAGDRAAAVLDATAATLRIDPQRLERLLRIGVQLDQGDVQPTGDGALTLGRIPPEWQRTVDSSLRLDRRGARGALPRLVFSSDALMEATDGGRRAYRERPDTRLMRLAHPVMRRATATLRRRLWEPRADLRRFTIGAHPDATAPTLVMPSLLAIVNVLREPLHAELIEVALRVEGNDGAPVGAPLGDPVTLDATAVDRWRMWLEDRWDDLAESLGAAREEREAELRARAEHLVPLLLKDERTYQDKLFKTRLRELDEETRRGGEGEAAPRGRQAGREDAPADIRP